MTTDSVNLERNNNRAWLIVTVCLLAAVLPYLNAGRTVLFFDSLILENTPEAKDVSLALEALARSALFPGQELTTLTIAVNHRINGLLGYTGFHAPGFVAANIALHASHTLCVYFLISALVQFLRQHQASSPVIPLVGAILYAVHPIHVTTILDVVQRRSILAGFFQTIALLAYLKWRINGAARHRWVMVAVLAFWCCMKSRSTGLAMPLSIIALELVHSLGNPVRLRRFLQRGSAATAVAAFILLAFMWKSELFTPATMSFRSPQTMNAEADWGGWQQALTQARAYPAYWRLLGYPRSRDLCVDHAFPPTRALDDRSAWGWVTLHVVIIAASLVAAFRGFRVAAFGVLVFYVSQIPWLLLPHPVQVVEYRLYGAALAPMLIIAELLARIPRIATRRMAMAGCAVASLTLGFVTWNRNILFRSHVEIWKDVASKYPGRFRSEYNLGNALFRAGQIDAACLHYQNACVADPVDYRPHYNLGNAHYQMGRIAEAAMEYRETLRRKPDHRGARQGLSECLGTP